MKNRIESKFGNYYVIRIIINIDYLKKIMVIIIFFCIYIFILKNNNLKKFYYVKILLRKYKDNDFIEVLEILRIIEYKRYYFI